MMIYGRPIVTAAEMRSAEAAMVSAGVSVDQLMARAGRAIADAVLRFGGGRDTMILCGPGNNGGDGYVAARLLAESGVDVRVAASASTQNQPQSWWMRCLARGSQGSLRLPSARV
jgi:hydroxyethylthiazole kinase-like uncharacterized protein yjeF